VQILFEKGADTTVIDKDRRMPLYMALLNGHKAIVRILFKKGANAIIIVKDGWMALHQLH
jgi:ankyrin repeat protein